MKTNTLRTAAAAGLTALVMGNAAAQESVSKPVGYETISIDQQFNYMGLRLLGATVATSTVETTALAGDDAEITLAGVSLDDGTYIVEVNDGDAIGAVVGGDALADTVVVPASLLDNLAEGDSVTIREAQTLASVFGDPVTDLDGSAGPGAADLILVPDGSGGFTTYYYNTGGFGGAGAGWKTIAADGSSVDVPDPAAVPLFYTDGLIIQNRGDDNSIVVSGSVKTTPTALALTTQFNYLSTVYPVGASLATLFNDPADPGVIAPGTIDGSAGPGAADLILVPEGDGFNTYYYNTGGFGGAGSGWKQVDASGVSNDINSEDISVDDASSIIIQNRGPVPQGVNVAAPDFYSSL